MSRRATLRLLLLGLLLCWCGVFLRSENTEKSIVRALLLEQTPEQWNVALLYQFPEAAADSSDAAASVQLCAGTGKTLEQALMSDPKERSEHNMLVDLGRNDIGKISQFGSVEVERYMDVLRYSHVMHIGSTVRGTIRPDKDAVDAVEAILPAGTLSGAPKFRACQIINELENNKRGIYGGAIGYIDFTGNLDTCIAIRLVYKKNGEICIRSGAGIVADSVPEKEYQECCNKVMALARTLLEEENL